MNYRLITIASLVVLLLVGQTLIAANELEVVEFRQNPLNLKGSVTPINDMNADPCAIIRIESDVVGRIDITSVTVYKTDLVSSGVIDHYISWRERNLVLTAAGYLPFHFKTPIELEKGKFYVLRVQTKGGPAPVGVGSLRIETEPAGASVKFNNIPVPGTTPLTLSDQPTGVHALLIEKDGYSPVEENVTIEKDKTLTKRWVLKKLVAGLRVTSDPSGVAVYLDGNRLGTTPLDRADLTPGEGALLVSKDGYEPNSQQIRLIAGQAKNIQVDLFPMTGSVSITTEPSGADVWLDEQPLGKYRGTALLREKLSLGRHTARAAMDGYEEASAMFNVEYNKTAPVVLKLSAKPGAIFVMTTPTGAEIYLDDRSVNQKSPFKLENIAAGQHKLRLALAGYGDAVKTVTVSPGKTETVSETMNATSVVARSEERKQSQQRIRGPLTGMEFVLIPGGSFMMGSPSNEKDRDNDEDPQHRVTLKPFYMMTTEVTQKQWTEVMGSNPSYFKGDNLPVEQVSWNDCQDFIRKLNQRDPGKGYRLPSEAEWEYACRSGTTTRFYWGDDTSYSQIGTYAWYGSNSSSRTHDVGTAGGGNGHPNGWGLCDMSGNVWEWCEDWYHNDYTNAPNDGSAWVSPSGSLRVRRGGCWFYGAGHCRSADRGSNDPWPRGSYLGFRLARSE